jgi:hypothetical protein
MNPAVVNLSISQRYQPLGRRLRDSLAPFGVALYQWFDELPAGAPKGLTIPYSAYCAKPFSMREAAGHGHDLLLWLDAACYAVKPLDPLWEHIEREGYYAQDNGWTVGQWCSDAALVTLGITREEAFSIPDISTCALGLDMRRPECRTFLDAWCALAADGVTFPGAHTNDVGPAKDSPVGYRNVGHVSDDPRVLGHRHDQTAASVLAWQRKWARMPRPVFVDYYDTTKVHDPRTLILNRG